MNVNIIQPPRPKLSLSLAAAAAGERRQPALSPSELRRIVADMVG